mgnify:CR=1 FL=1
MYRLQDVLKPYENNKNTTFKFREGENKIRIVSRLIPYTNYYQGRKNFKLVCYVIDRNDEFIDDGKNQKNVKIKLAFLPYTIAKQIQVFQEDSEYGFDDFPMPYDLLINAKNAGTIDVEYTLLPRPFSKLTPEEEKALSQKIDIEELVKKMEEDQKQLVEIEENNESENPLEIYDNESEM